MSKDNPKLSFYTKSKPIDKFSITEGISLMIKEQKNASLQKLQIPEFSINKN